VKRFIKTSYSNTITNLLPGNGSRPNVTNLGMAVGTLYESLFVQAYIPAQSTKEKNIL
jgi:hypothetical protein